MANILADPSALYLNIHTEEFIAGAVRDQLDTVPEPATSLLLFAAAGIWRFGRRR